ncbi:MAG: FdtA/QdtA family cupin domain-containing protein [Candidatus Vogelbacteria bacterium]|nr:FdtA/QdtA family cupin domain-containing protein [Candidatus Vogelbacteria bacterium]
MTAIKVNNSGTVVLQSSDDRPDGLLCIGEGSKNIPFEIKRFYFITGLSQAGAVRGKHAHRKISQAIFCLNGSFDLFLDDGKNTQTIQLNDPAQGILLGPLLWHTMTDFSPDCVILVVADSPYLATDYIRDYSEFKSLII